MVFGNFKWIFTLLFSMHTVFCYAVSKDETAEFLYQLLDTFLQNPTTSNAQILEHHCYTIKNNLNSTENQLAWVILKCNLAFHYVQFQNLKQAITNYENAWDFFASHKLNNYDMVSNCLQPLGNLYLKIGDLPKAEKTITNYLYKAEQSHNTPQLIAAIINLSVVYNHQSKYQKAITILKKGDEISPKNLNILNNLATNYVAINQLKTAEKHALKVIDLDPKQVNSYMILAKIALKRKQLSKAHNYVKKAKDYLTKKPKITARKFAKWHLSYIDILLTNAEYDFVQLELKTIYQSLIPSYDPENLIPRKETLIADPILLKALDVQAFLFLKTSAPIKAIETYELGFEVHRKLIASYLLEDTQLLRHAENRNRVENYIEILFELHKTNKNQLFIKKAFQAVEYSKAPVITEALLSKAIFKQYQQDALVIQRNQLKLKCSELETLLFTEKAKGTAASIAKIQEWSNLYTEITTALHQNTKALHHKFPKLLLGRKKIQLKALQLKLAHDNTSLVEYFYGNRAIYQFQIDKDSISAIKIPVTNDFTSTIKKNIHFYDNAATITNNVKKFIENSYDTFTALQLPVNKKQLIIIPDGLLYYIPMEALLFQKTNEFNFNRMPFLIKKSCISYEISAAKYLNNSSNFHSKKSVLGVFPIFKNTKEALPFSALESKAIKNNFDGLFLMEDKATYASFLNKHHNHSVIHLSTHAQSGTFQKPAFIKFIDKDVFLNELYGQNFNNELAVLSACETGVGQLIKGEGPLSISRGFQYAGIPNTLFSLWKVNDKTTSLLMRNFYEVLRRSKNKKESLYQAKIDYLNNETISNTLKSPYYWGAFVYFGEVAPQKTAFFNFYYAYYIIPALILCLFIIRFLKERINHSYEK